ncbi:MAG: caspase family protein [Rhodoferax sp.]|uniref:caspase family protein n=1 Tax=Rhodoferax sp. TaxID=50421 RepID=UPI003016B481
MLFKMKLKPLCLLLGALAGGGVSTVAQAQLAPGATPGQALTAVRATELRADKLASAPVLQSLAVGAALRLVSVEGGWALVETTPANKTSAKLSGWVRASAVSLPQAASLASGLASGRESAGNTALTLGVRSLPPRINRHALIIGISRYADPATPSLPGARIDKESATQMAQAMQVPQSNIRYLQDDQATGNNIRQALKDLTDKVEDGDRVFIHYSGHGTRYNDPAAGGCVEALLAYDGGTSGMITNHEMADMLKTITNKTDKLFVMYDACHSGGLVAAASSVRTRGFSNRNDDGQLRPKFASISEECGRPVNIKTRNLVVEAAAKGALPQDIIHVSASRDNEISFDDELKGGLATQFMRDCMLREAKDLDNSGAISMDEIKQCAQEKINKRMANDVNYKPHNLVLNGNAAFVPAWFSQASALAPVVVPVIVPVTAVPIQTATAATATAPVAVKPPVVASPVAGTFHTAVPVAEPPPEPLTGAQALRQMFDQRDAKRRVQVTLSKDKLKIGQDVLDFSVQSERAGFVYVALAGSDNQAVYLLFPNELDKNNQVEAGQQLLLPRPNWRVKAGGPAGTDHLLVMVTDAPRDLSTLAANKAGPFVMSLNDAQGRAKLGALMTTSQMGSSPACAHAGSRKKNVLCSDAYGASMITVEEVK